MNIAHAPEFGACEFQQFTVSNTAGTLESFWVAAGGTAFDSLAIKKNQLSAIIDVESDMRYDPAGGTPTTTKGVRIIADLPVIFENQYRLLKTMKVIRDGASDAVVNMALFY